MTCDIGSVVVVVAVIEIVGGGLKSRRAHESRIDDRSVLLLLLVVLVLVDFGGRDELGLAFVSVARGRQLDALEQPIDLALVQVQQVRVARLAKVTIGELGFLFHIFAHYFISIMIERVFCC